MPDPLVMLLIDLQPATLSFSAARSRCCRNGGKSEVISSCRRGTAPSWLKLIFRDIFSAE